MLKYLTTELKVAILNSCIFIMSTVHKIMIAYMYVYVSKMM